jgi:membrane associated rhomboid family serine protease
LDQILLSIQQTPVAAAIFVITLLVSLLAFSNDEVYDNFILHPYSVAQGKRTYTLITSGLIHADLQHLFFNMLTFYFFAFTAEHDLGHVRFGILYFASLVLSDLPTVNKYKNDYGYYSLGASGAISAVIFSCIIYNPWGGMGLIFIPGLYIPAILFGVLYLYYCSYASKRGIGNINHDAHFFGALCGVMITVILHPDIVPAFLRVLAHPTWPK